MLKARAPFVRELPDDAWFDVSLMRKDVRLALDAADRLDVPAPAGRAALMELTRAGELGYDHRDIAALFEVLDQTS
jgi:3-hydroxyisobutyrate dehydrogenase-like beta-hydroxyacid dehydrogenase